MTKKKWMGITLIVFALVIVFISCAEYPSESGAEPPDSTATRLPAPIARPPTPEESRASAEEMRASVDQHIEEMMERARIAAQTQDEGVPTVHGGVIHRTRQTFIQSAPNMFPNASGPFSRQLSERRLIGDNEELYNACLLVFSRAVVNEANWIHRECGTGVPGPCDPFPDHNHAELDGPAMFSVFRHTRFDHETLLGVMRRHMNYVTEEVPARRPRTRWISELDLEGTRPAHFQETDSEGHPLNWERDYLPRWRDTIAMARRLFAGHDLGGCGNTPVVTWGGRCEDAHGACDDENGWSRGLVPVECAPGSSNRLWCHPGVGSCPAHVERPSVGVASAESPQPSPAVVEAPPEESVEPVAPPVPVVEETPEESDLSPLALAL